MQQEQQGYFSVLTKEMAFLWTKICGRGNMTKLLWILVLSRWNEASRIC